MANLIERAAELTAAIENMSPELKAFIKQCAEKAEAAQAQPARKLTLKVSEKGAVSLYGMGRFPVTLYGTQWERLLNEADTIKAFLATNASLLATKPTA